ncbi:acyltransferase [Ectothiorhodospira mobilis]|uniref:acyltransferase n=1 Tax=Ectothiorhodospira mobilis TaxID=195064 RepID=UPI000B897E76|nr:acyltransferase [Ectothiorhodospira mobilis]MCG5536375.1 acyltransferase [Ectothiorhodospira mobilis]
MIPIIKKTPEDAQEDEYTPATKPKSDIKNTESEFLNLLRTATKKDLDVLSRLLMPHIARHELTQPRIWGDPGRVHLDQCNISINDLLINTRSGHVTIKQDCFFGHRCMLLTGTHDYMSKGMERLKAVPSSGRDIIVERGVWMGSGVMVLGPAVIGQDAVIAAGSLVIGDVPPSTLVAGRPAKPIKSFE